MRLRHIPGAEQRIAESRYVIHDPAARRGLWASVFQNDGPLCIECGMGKGRFITEMAERHPDINYLGIERYSSVLLKAEAKQLEKDLPNLRFLCADAKELPAFFAPGEIAEIYLNFSDPWPKDRHAARRLTSPVFMDIYRRILAPSGHVEFKTDNRGLFDYSVDTIPRCGFKLTALTYDLHRSTMGIDNVMTEYEAKFSAEGKSICKLIAMIEGGN